MTIVRLLGGLHLLLFVFVLDFAASADAVWAQGPTVQEACQTDPRFVRMLGTYQGSGPNQGRPICEWTGTGTVEQSGSPPTTATCLNTVGQQVVQIGAHSYCLWYHSPLKAYLASIMFNPGSQPPLIDDIYFPTPQAPSVLSPGICALRSLGTWRGVPVCQVEGPGTMAPLPQKSCGGASYPVGRIRIYPDDFTAPPPPGANGSPPAGTRFCVTSAPYWDRHGTRAVVLAQHDLGIDAHFVRPLLAGGNSAAVRIWISSVEAIPAQNELIVSGSLTPAAPFAAWTNVTPGWTCNGDWSAFSCRTTLATALAAPKLLELRTSYTSASSGQNVVYSAMASMTHNYDPRSENSSMTVATTLY